MLLFVSDANLPVRFTSKHILLPLSDYDPRRVCLNPSPVGKSCAHACHVTEALVAYLRQ